jgi:hypothetical protein
MPKEPHPYIADHFDDKIIWKYLIIGTFPPKLGCKERKDLFPYFYGNQGSLWQILNETGLYPDFNFDSVENIKLWQKAYSVGITDVLVQCSRKSGKECSPADIDLIVDYKTDLNASLKVYVLNNIEHIECIYFTSGGESENGNSAYFLFTKLMGNDLFKIPQNKIVKLPSPSGEFLRTVFSKAKTNFGLKPYFYKYLTANYQEAISIAEHTFELKKNSPKTILNNKGKEVKVKIKRFPNSLNYPSLYRLHLYKELLPKNKIEK